MIDLVQWLSAQLDYDEQVARDTDCGGCSWTDGEEVVVCNNHGRIAAGPYGGFLSDGDHIALHDPARVLRQVAAHRCVLSEAERQLADDTTDAAATWQLHNLAAIYSDRPGFDPSWTVEP